MKPQSRRESGPPVVDETAFQQLLSAAYVMQEHNNRLKKPAAQVAAPVTVATAPAVVVPDTPAETIPFSSAQPPASAGSSCQECGSALAANEFFCDSCGAPAERPNNTMQKNWASLWEMHQSAQTETNTATKENNVPSASLKTVHPEETTDEEIDLFPVELEQIIGKFSEPETDEESETEAVQSEPSVKALRIVEATPPAATTENAAVTPATSIWTSASKARAWLDSLKPQQKSKDWFRDEWNLHRGMISIALASAVLLVVLFQWVTRPATVPGQPRQLSAFEQMLVSMGLAEAPTPDTPAPQPGNPNTKVWVDVHTALYYCPGADLYGKTADGKYTSQLDAQRDNFRPSTLKACD